LMVAVARRPAPRSQRLQPEGVLVANPARLPAYSSGTPNSEDHSAPPAAPEHGISCTTNLESSQEVTQKKRGRGRDPQRDDDCPNPTHRTRLCAAWTRGEPNQERASRAQDDKQDSIQHGRHDTPPRSERDGQGCERAGGVSASCRRRVPPSRVPSGWTPRRRCRGAQ